MKKRLKKGSLTIETALIMSLLLLIVMSVIYLFFWVHNRAWLTAAAYEAALDGSMAMMTPDGKSYQTALGKGKELGNMGFFGGDNLEIQAKSGRKVQIQYDMDTISSFGGFSWYMQAKGSAKVIRPVSWIRKIKSAAETVKQLEGA